ncbi:hypothetical protein [Leptospira interrogans]|uniref:hypothetical protein n=1 Tax=Leptospira interrogans TaxID=173 RepID=UPI0007744E7E|nr:hypothetical protein [Leptospira interrogans]WOT09330.1 hypothetical protein CFY92_0009365 [Leptospira interrogans]
MAKKKSTSIQFTIFRYQILPISQSFQPDLIGEIKTIDDLVKKKNELFYSAIKPMKFPKHRGKDLIRRTLYDDGVNLIFKLGAKKEILVDNQNLERVSHTSWPNIFVLINNSPDKQMIAVSQNPNAFSDPLVVLKELVDRNVNAILKKSNLKFIRNDLFEEREFWKIIKEYKGQIQSINFELISPNMANISKALTLDLKTLKKKNNVQMTELKISSDPTSTIVVDKEDKFIKGLVEYSSLGGGNVTLKIRGLQKRVQAKAIMKEISIEEMEFDGLTASQAKKLLEKISNV